MSTDIRPMRDAVSEAAAGTLRVTPYRLTVSQFSRMIDAGVFPGSARVELLGGVLVEKMTQNEPHVFGVDELRHRIQGLLSPAWTDRQEKPIALGRFWRPEPDLVVARGPRETYRLRLPHGDDVGMIIEVADASYDVDRGPKWRRYAAARIPAYGILNIPARRFELYGDPVGRGRSAAYREATIYDENAEIPIVLDGRELGRIAVKDVLA